MARMVMADIVMACIHGPTAQPGVGAAALHADIGALHATSNSFFTFDAPVLTFVPDFNPQHRP